MLWQSEFVQRGKSAPVVEYAQDDVLAVEGGQDRGAQIDLPTVYEEGNVSILGRPCFGDVHSGQHFQPDVHCRPVSLVDRPDLSEQAVDTIADTEKSGLGFKMNVRGFLSDGIGQYGVNESNDRLFRLCWCPLVRSGICFFCLEFIENAVDCQFVAVSAVDCAIDVRFPCQ